MLSKKSYSKDYFFVYNLFGGIGLKIPVDFDYSWACSITDSASGFGPVEESIECFLPKSGFKSLQAHFHYDTRQFCNFS